MTDPEEIIVKFLNDEITELELVWLEYWIQDPDNDLIFKSYVRTHYTLDLAVSPVDSKRLKEQMSARIRKEKGFYVKKIYKETLKYAALLIVLLGVFHLMYEKNNAFSVKNQVVPGGESITLYLDNGEIRTLSEEGEFKIMDDEGNELGVQKKGALEYKNDNVSGELRYNTLKIPFGKTFQVSLSDGTLVILNSGSTLMYPVEFVAGEPREVYLEGEAFFEVAHDKLRPFKVESNGMKLEVLGTRFNLSSYPEDRDVEVVLVNGAVAMGARKTDSSTIDNRVVLEPGNKGVFNRESKKTSKAEVDVDLYTSWLEGNLVVRNEPFDVIIKKLERIYNVKIINNNSDLGNEKFNATIETRRETIEQVLTYFDKIYGMEYDVSEEKIIIK